MYVHDIPYLIIDQDKKSVTTDEGNVDLAGKTAYLHNAGTAKIYIDNKTGVTSDKWELSPGEKQGPLTGHMYYVGAANTTLKILYIDFTA